MNRRQNNVFVLGAGFSASQGFPLMRGLRERVIHFMQAEQHCSYWYHLLPHQDWPDGQFFAGLSKVDPDERFKFEELLIALRSASLNLSKNPWENPHVVTLDSIKIGTARFFWCIQNGIWLNKEYRLFADRVGGLMKQNATVTVVIFNWDLLMEKALTERGVPWSYDPASPGVTILKPHGSINWSSFLKEGTSSYAGWRPIFAASQISFDHSDPLANPDLQSQNPPFMYALYPGDPEESTSDPNLRLAWNHISERLRRADSVVFIGYSLPGYDLFACRSLASGVRADAKIDAYVPDARVLQRYRQSFGAQAEVHEETFEQCPWSKGQ